eukprot:CCRYP_002484-RA/>CCRYP_002484-RA protein AED:0.13 eAED:0.13 QI:478/1/1/1/0/0/2/613/524
MLVKSTSDLFERMDNKRKQHPAHDDVEDDRGASIANKSQRVLTLRELIPPKQFRKSNASHARSLRLADIRPEVVLPTIVNDDNEEEEETTDTQQTTTTTRKNKKKKRGNQLDWTAVIARVQSHPREAGESYFVRSTPSSPDGPVPIVDPSTSSNNNNSNAAQEHTILTYKPLHAMLKYDPPLAAVQAVLKAHPHAALDVTFEGTALKIAAESRVSSSSVLRLLLVAEMAMRKKVLIEERLAKSRAEEADRDGNDDDKKEETIDSSSVVSAPAPPIIDNETLTNNFDLVTVLPSPSSSPSRMFVGHNPIRWIAESHIPRKSAALLLKWYPVGAFQRPRDDDGLPVEEIEQDYQDEDAMYSDSPLIEIIDDFASDQDVLLQEQRENHEVDDDDDAQEEEQDESASGEDDDDDDDSSTGQELCLLPRRRRTFAEREYWRKERRWEKFLHILYATDKILMSMKPSTATTTTTTAASMEQGGAVVTVSADASTIAPSSTESPSPRPRSRPKQPGSIPSMPSYDASPIPI